MARSVIIEQKPEFTATFNNTNNISSKFTSESVGRVFIGGKPSFRRFNATPFKVQFRTTNVESYSPTNPAPVGVAIIGYSNYIL